METNTDKANADVLVTETANDEIGASEEVSR